MIKKFYKYTLLAACAALTLASCSEDEVVAPGEWDAAADYANVSFVEATASAELDPTDPTTYTLHLSRTNTSGAISVPVVITNGQDSIFTVTDANFADGDSIAAFTVSFPEAEIGTTYEVQFAVQDTRFVSSYSNASTASLTVTRVKWNPAGYYYDSTGNRVNGYALYTDNLVGFLYGAGNVTWPVELQERDDKPGMYRIISPYKTYPYVVAGYADWTGPEYNMVINATDTTRVFFDPTDYDLGFTFDPEEYGNPIIRNRGYGTLQNGAITFPPQAFYLGLTIYTSGSWGWYSNPDGAFMLLIDPDKYEANTKYEATLEDDFDWQEEYTGTFTSHRSDAAETATLYKGVCETTTDDCDSVFQATYGTPYILEAPYAEGYDLLFFVKNGRVSLHNDFKDAFTYQEIGQNDGLNDIYARINASDCSFSDDEITLNITFVALNRAGNEVIVYGTSDEVLTRPATPAEARKAARSSRFNLKGKNAVRTDFRRVILPNVK